MFALFVCHCFSLCFWLIWRDWKSVQERKRFFFFFGKHFRPMEILFSFSWSKTHQRSFVSVCTNLKFIAFEAQQKSSSSNNNKICDICKWNRCVPFYRPTDEMVTVKKKKKRKEERERERKNVIQRSLSTVCPVNDTTEVLITFAFR